MKNEHHSSENTEPVSKSQRRREALETRSLAAELIRMDAAALARIPLDEDIADAIDEARRIRSHVARKRQMQYVAKILRRIDPEPIAQAIEDLKGEARHLTARQHRCEAWRDHLIREGDLALGQLMGARHDTDAQAVRQLVRNAVREAARDKPPAAARSLFRLLRDMDGLEPLPPPPSS